jgi:serine/threonine protein kinase
MGALYLAVHGGRGLEKLCVVKTVLPHLAGSGYVQRFRDEAKVVVRLSHGNLVAVFDAGQVGSELFLAMDFVEGRDLRAVWNKCAQKGIAFPVDVAVHLTKELVRGLGYAHAFEGLSLVHRDVSPPNVLVSYTGEVKLTDFGLASSTLKLEKTAPGLIYGKVSYMAPEQARGEPIDGRTDLYAAAIILWELLTGRQLFPATPNKPGNSDDDLLEKVRHPAPQPPSKRAARVPAELDRIVLKALAVNPAERYQSGEEMRADLAAFQAKTAPATDGDHVARFMKELFGDQIGKERVEREALVARSTELAAADEARRAGGKGKGPGGEARRDAGAHSGESTVADGKPQGSPRAGPGESIEAEAPDVPIRPAPPRTPDTPPLALEPDKTGSLAADAASRVVGTTLGGRYLIKRLCGEGGMGRVYEAEHVEIGKRVAVKVLHPAYSRTPEVVERFRREARAASRIVHPNVVNVTDSGTTDDGSFFFVMEYVEGVELGLAIFRGGPMPAKRMMHIAAQVADALQAAHDAGVIHRDLKPENVLLVSREHKEVVRDFKDFKDKTQPTKDLVLKERWDDVVKVLDFGIAKSADVEEEPTRGGRKLTRPGVAMGTPEYMAPEQAAGKPADARSDVYALGSIMYEMLTATPPYDGDNVMEVLHKKANTAPRPLREARPDVSAEIEDVVERAMARNPAERPQSMAELASELRAHIEGMPATTPAPVLAPPPPRRESPLMTGAIDALPVRSAFPVPRKVVGIAAGVLVAAGLLVVVRAATPRQDATAAQAAAEQAEHAKPAAAAKPTEPAPVQPPSPPAAPAPLDTGTVAGTEAPNEAPVVVEEPASPERKSRGKARAGRSARAPSRVAGAGRLLDEGWKQLETQRYPEAREAFAKVTGGKREGGSALLGLGLVAFQEGNYPEAVARAQDSAKRASGQDAIRARILLGDALYRLKRYDEAKVAYTDALKRDPHNAVAKRNLENVLRKSP